MKKITPENRLAHFLSKVDIPDDREGCWKWQDCPTSGGYAQYRVGNRKIRVHRYSYQIFKGPILAGLLVCHTCDNPMCVNPRHLFLGSEKDNTQDMIRKGRKVIITGENHHWAKLTNQEVVRIIELRNQGLAQQDIANAVGVSRPRVSQILTDPRYGNYPKRKIRITR